MFQPGFPTLDKFPVWICENNISNPAVMLEWDANDERFKSAHLPDWDDYKDAGKQALLESLLGSDDILTGWEIVIGWVRVFKMVTLAFRGFVIVKRALYAAKQINYTLAEMFAYGGHSKFASNETEFHYACSSYVCELILSQLSEKTIRDNIEELEKSFEELFSYGSIEAVKFKSSMMTRHAHVIQRHLMNRCQRLKDEGTGKAEVGDDDDALRRVQDMVEDVSVLLKPPHTASHGQ